MITLHHKHPERIIIAMENNVEVGNIEYEVSDNAIAITHTRAYIEGRGIGRILVEGIIEFAKEHQMKVLPHCSYAKALMNKVDEYRSLIPDT